MMPMAISQRSGTVGAIGGKKGGAGGENGGIGGKKGVDMLSVVGAINRVHQEFVTPVTATIAMPATNRRPGVGRVCCRAGNAKIPRGKATTISRGDPAKLGDGVRSLGAIQTQFSK